MQLGIVQRNLGMPCRTDNHGGELCDIQGSGFLPLKDYPRDDLLTRPSLDLIGVNSGPKATTETVPHHLRNVSNRLRPAFGSVRHHDQQCIAGYVTSSRVQSCICRKPDRAGPLEIWLMASGGQPGLTWRWFPLTMLTARNLSRCHPGNLLQSTQTRPESVDRTPICAFP